MTGLGVVVVGWFLGGQKSTRAGQLFFQVRQGTVSETFLSFFFNSPHRETPKNVIKTNREEVGFGFGLFCRFVCCL
jgi:hypothetical protein